MSARLRAAINAMCDPPPAVRGGRRWRAFWLGVKEFRLGCTQHYDDYVLLEAYELGREWAHRLTFRRFES